MTKYYVQSGTMRSVVEAESSRKAALWAVHQAMQQVLPVEESIEDIEEWSDRAEPRTLSVLAGKVRVSQTGFDRSDATQMATMEVVCEWNQMVTTLDRLERMLYRAA